MIGTFLLRSLAASVSRNVITPAPKHNKAMRTCVPSLRYAYKMDYSLYPTQHHSCLHTTPTQRSTYRWIFLTLSTTYCNLAHTMLQCAHTVNLEGRVDMPVAQEIYWTPKEVAERFRVSEETIRRYVRTKKLRAVRFGDHMR